MSRSPRALLAPALVLLLALAGCHSPSGEATSAVGGLGLTDAWVKAADSGMTAAFGTLTNTSDHAITLVSATSAVARVELHEVTTGPDGSTSMHPKEGGFVVPALGSLTLAPGGLHLMLMGLSSPLAPGDSVDLTVVADDGSSWTFPAPVRTFTGANESYQGGSTSGTSESPMPSATP